jgi:hypothetical protein
LKQIIINETKLYKFRSVAPSIHLHNMSKCGLLRIACVSDIANEIRGETKWFDTCGNHTGSYRIMKDGTPITYKSIEACNMKSSVLPYLIRDVSIENDDLCDGNYFMSVLGSTCIMNGSCSFHGRECTFRIVTWKSLDTSHGVETLFFYQADRTSCIATIFFYLELGVNDNYNPYIIKSDKGCVEQYCLTVFCDKKTISAKKFNELF